MARKSGPPVVNIMERIAYATLKLAKAKKAKRDAEILDAVFGPEDQSNEAANDDRRTA